VLGTHLVGLYEKALSPTLNWDERLRIAKAIGFDYVEISIDEDDTRIERLYWDNQKIEELRRSTIEQDIPIMSMCLSAHRRFPFGSADIEKREKAYDIMQRAIDFASRMGIRVIQLAGYDVYYEQSSPESVRLFKHGMHWAAKYAAQKQVMLAMEIMDTPFMNSISKHMVYEQEIDSPWYKVYPDLGNLTAWPENDEAAEIEKGISSIVAVHLKDTIPPHGDECGKFKCVPFGAGCVDFPARFAQLEQLGYTGPYMVEMWHDGPTTGEELAKSNLDWIKGQFEQGMRMCKAGQKV